MKILKRIIIGIAVLIAILLIAALFVKKDYSVEKEIVINKPKSRVFEYIKFLKNQDHFSKWATMDPYMKKTYRGTDGTIDFVAAWESEIKDVGAGEQEIKKITDGERIDFELRFIKPFESTETAYMTTESVGENQTKVTWGFKGDMNYPMNIMMVFMNIEKMIGDDLQTGLNNLKNVLEKKSNDMDLGAFSISLAVKDIHKSKEFYEKLGFTYKGGNIDQNWIVLKNGDAVIGLFQGMFEDNILTFNPGWDKNAQNLEEFDDVRSIQKNLKSKGIVLTREADERTTGPEYITLTDPDGNNILIDQHR